MKKKLLLTLVVLTCISGLTGKKFFEAPLASPGADPAAPRVKTIPAMMPLLDQFEAFVRRRMAEDGVPGVAVAIVKDSNIVYLRGFGKREINGYDSVDIHTVFRLASISKGFAPVLTAMLVDEGKLTWDDRIQEYLPNFRLRDARNARQLSVRHVLSHTTGLPRHTYTHLLSQGLSYQNILQRLPQVRVLHPVGTRYNYQNVTYSLVGDVIEKTTGRTYQDLLKERLFEPLGMRDASCSYQEIMKNPNVALPHRPLKGGAYAPMDISPNFYSASPAAGVNASAADMARWLQFLLGHRPDVFDTAKLEEVFRPQVVVSNGDHYNGSWNGLMNRSHYALGWRVVESGMDTIHYHGGFVNGYRSEMGFIRKDGIGVAVLTNAPNQFISECLPTFFRYYLDHRKELRKWPPMELLAVKKLTLPEE
jgi:beta-lactamase class C